MKKVNKKKFKNDDKNELKVPLYESQFSSLKIGEIFIHILMI